MLDMFMLMSNAQNIDGLPTFGNLINWGTTIVVQLITLAAFFFIAKNFLKFKLGGIIVTCLVAGVVVFFVMNFNVIIDWGAEFASKL